MFQATNAPSTTRSDRMSTTENQRDPWVTHDAAGSAGGAHAANMDSELASIVSSLSALSSVSAHQQHGQIGSFRRGSFHSNQGSDVESEMLFHTQTSPPIKRTTLSVGGMPLGGPSGVNNRLSKMKNYSGSLAGGSVLQQQPIQGGFFERFGRSLAEGTREVELNLGSTSGRASRRESMNAMDSLSRATTNSTFQGVAMEGRRTSVASDAMESLSENLNMQPEEPGNLNHRNIWKVAEAPVFRPQASENSGMEPAFPQPPAEALNQPYGFSYPNYWKMGAPMIPLAVPPSEQLKAGKDFPEPSAAGGNVPVDPSSQPFPPFMFPNNPYLFFPPGATPPPPPHPFQPAASNPKDLPKGPNAKTHGNPYLYNSRNHKPARGSPSAPFPPQPNPAAAANSSTPRGKGKYNVVRSPLLEEFRNNSSGKEYRLPDIYGSALEFCKDQHGSRFIQQELVKATDTEKEVIFNEIRDEAINLADDVFGNYVIQKYFEHGLKSQKDVLFEKFTGKMEKLSLQMYACRVIQRALECIDLDQKVILVNELSGCVLKMIKDQNGNHVIQKAIERIPIEKLPFILGSLEGQIYHLSTHSYGCRVVQRLLEYGTLEDQEKILADLDQFIPFLIQDQYGNYVIQHILKQGPETDDTHIGRTKQNIVDIVCKNVVEYSKHKFASNVVEKTMVFGSPAQKKQFMEKVLPESAEHATRLEDNAPLILMMRDQYANYVVQKLVGVAEGDDKKVTVIAIRSYLEKLNKINALGNRHLASVEKLAAIVENVQV